MKILFAGGGTAGHINPALAVADYIKSRHPDAEISYIGTAEKLEATLVPQKGYDFYTIKVAGFRRSLSPKAMLHNVNAVKLAATSLMNAKKILKKVNPDIVVGTGGYVSGPVIRAAQQLGIKTAIHEQNAFPGVTTKMVASKANRVMLAMPEAQKYLKLNKKPDITGNPIRTELTLKSREEARAILGLTEDKPLILSFGGSLGAKRVNESVAELIKWHNPTDKFYHIHATGKVGYDDMLQNLADTPLSDKVRIREYIDDMDVCMAAADLVICRAGAITLGELQACGKPSVLIPSPYVAENHQYHNALTLKKDGAAEIIEEKDLTGEALIKTVESLIENKEKLEKMSQSALKGAITDSNQRIYEILMQLYTNA
jgi:UDP-N-acetylglucosamine--N-acetylmuramyl-(pentapeptide) pyrophosphoryl-undecaprenol N-acetylglucosamine transferase